jgi:hypothetical protein
MYMASQTKNYNEKPSQKESPMNIQKLCLLCLLLTSVPARADALRDAFEVKVNGKDCGILWHSPYEVDVTGMLQAGTNELEIRVVNLWPNRIIGDLRNPTAKPFTFSQLQLYSAADALLPSGLLGPVKLRTMTEIPLNR